MDLYAASVPFFLRRFADDGAAVVVRRGLSCTTHQLTSEGDRWQLAHQRQASAMQGFYNLTETATNLRGASASLVFNGTAISYFGNFVSNGAHILFDLDGRKFNVSSISPTDPERRQSLLWDLADLSPSVEHRLTVTMMSGMHTHYSLESA